MYVTMCSCGAEIRTVSKQGKCKKCGREFCLAWPTEYRRVVKVEKTISEKYDDSARIDREVRKGTR